MPQFYFENDILPGDTLILGDEVYHHVKNVRRARRGDEIELRLKDGTLYSTTILEFNSKSISVEVKNIKKQRNIPYTLTLAMPVLKAKKNEFIIEKGVEIGITNFIIIHYDRSIPDYKSIGKKIDKWQKTAYEAYKQSYAEFLPVVKTVVKSGDFFKAYEDTCKIVADVHSEDLWNDMYIHLKNSVTIAIGPEGGFTDNEIRTAIDNGWIHARFKYNQLKAETASIIIPAVLRNYMVNNDV